jgi:hypothetical protein
MSDFGRCDIKCLWHSDAVDNEGGRATGIEPVTPAV